VITFSTAAHASAGHRSGSEWPGRREHPAVTAQAIRDPGGPHAERRLSHPARDEVGPRGSAPTSVRRRALVRYLAGFLAFFAPPGAGIAGGGAGMGDGGAAIAGGAGGGSGGGGGAALGAAWGGGETAAAALALAADAASAVFVSLASPASHATARRKKRPPPRAVNQRGVFGSSGSGSSCASADVA
jgi:hypothetical protein